MENLVNLFNLLKPRGMKLRVSEATGIGTGNLSAWERGKYRPSADALVKMSEYFGVSVDYLTGKTDDPTPAKSKAPAEAGALSAEGVELNSLLDGMTEENKQKLLAFGRFLASEQSP